MASPRKRGRNWFDKFVATDGRPTERKGFADRRATEQLAREVESEVARQKVGIIDPREEAPAGFEPAVTVLQTDALPLGYGATPGRAILAGWHALRQAGFCSGAGLEGTGFRMGAERPASCLA